MRGFVHFPLWFLIMTCTVRQGIGQSFTRPTCELQASSTCIAFDPNPSPEPFEVLDKLGRRLDQNGKPIVPIPTPPGTNDPLVDIVARAVDIPKEEEGVFRVRRLKLERYFPGMDIGQVESDYDGTDLEIIEWPGIISDKKEGDKTTGVSYQDNLQKKLHETFIPMSYEGDVSSFKNYDCNRRLGTHIRAMGFRPNDPTNPRYADYNPFYFSFGHRSFHRDFVQPLYAPVSQLNVLAEGHTDPDCQPIDPTVPFTRASTKLNHILTFTFATNRIIFGMHCGILILKPIDAATNRIVAAERDPNPNDDDNGSVLRTDFKITATTKFQRFIGKINRVSSNVCCQGLCFDMGHLAVAYSYNLDTTEESLRRVYVSFDHGDTWDQKIVSATDSTFLKLIRSLYLPLNLTLPDFISRRIIKAKAKGQWGSDTDHVVDLLMGKPEAPETPHILPNEVYCAELVSVQVVIEEKGFLALCRTDLGDPRTRKHPLGYLLNLNYGIFQFEISRFSPLIHARMKSKRRLACTIKDTDMDPGVTEIREPQLFKGRRGSGSTLIILGCESVLYFSINAGYTFWNAIFYVATEAGTYERQFQLPTFSFPLVAFDPEGISMTFTFGDSYAVGFIAYTREFRVLVGRIAETEGRVEEAGLCAGGAAIPPGCTTTCLNPALAIPDCNRVRDDCIITPTGPDCDKFFDTFIKFSSNRKFIPYYTNSGDIKFSVSVMDFLLENPNPNQANYAHRKAMRLIDVPFKLTDVIRPFFAENRAVAVKSKGFRKCSTFAFTVDNREEPLDLGYTTTFSVSVEDNNRDIALGIFGALPDELKIDVIKNTSRRTGMLSQERQHTWQVSVSPRPVPKSAMHLIEDTIFGSNYDVYVYKSANLVMTNYPAQRCHTQPIGSVLLHLGCSNKQLVAHEDYNRPHCGRFFGAWNFDEKKYSTFTFRLQPGKYDPEMLRYWRKRAGDSADAFERDGDDWVVKYDYGLFGCPIEPYRLEHFQPDLRVMDLKLNSNVSDTIHGIPFTGQYILIEVFGQTGYSYLKTVREAGCRRKPRNFKTLLAEWKDRRQAIFDGFTRYKSFHPDEVADPQNIWQKSIHEPCEIPERKAPESIDDLRIPYDEPYEVMQRGSGNAIVWDRKERKDIYFFMAIDVDATIDSFCDYKTFFAVTLNADARADPGWSVIRFLLVFIFLIILLILGYYIYRIHTQRGFHQAALVAKLERGAWEILLRYEKYLHEVEMHGNTPAVDTLESDKAKAHRKSTKKSHGGGKSVTGGKSVVGGKGGGKISMKRKDGGSKFASPLSKPGK